MPTTLSVTEVSAATRLLECAKPEDKIPEFEHRKQARKAYEAERHVFLISAAALQVVPVATREISQGGISFLALFAFVPDQEFVLTLPSAKGCIAILCRVRHVEDRGGNCHLVGASFEEVYKENALPCAVPPMWVKIVDAVMKAANAAGK